MSDITNNNVNDTVEQHNMTGSNAENDPSRPRQQPLQRGPQIRRIYQGQQPPTGFRFARRHVQPDVVLGSNSNTNRAINENDDGVQTNRLNVGANGNANTNRNRNVQRLRINMGGRGSFVVRQHQHRPNPISRTPQNHQQVQQQEQQQPQQQQQQQQHVQYHPMGPNGHIQLGPNGPVSVRMVQVRVDSLSPQPLSASAPSNRGTNNAANARGNSGISNQRAEDPPNYERYKCEICYEYMNDPVGCGKCASRFCRTCLQRVYESDAQKQQPTKCPVCRCEYSEAVPDLTIYGSEGEKTPTLPCRHVCIGCPEKKLPLFQIAQHEQVCEHVPMRCRYSQYGCRWVGKRGLVHAHEEFGCKLAPIGNFIEQFRQTKADHTMRLEMISQQSLGAVRMSHVLRQTYTRDNQRKSLSDSLRMFQYCHAVTCLTPHFLMTKDLWVSYWRNNESRAAVANFCVCVPLLAAAFGVVGRGTSCFFELFEDGSPGRTIMMLARAIEGANMNITNSLNSTTAISSMIQNLQQSESEELFLNAFLGLCVGTLGIMVVMLGYIDTKSNISWDKISLPYLSGRYPLVGDVVTVSIFTLLLAIMEYHTSKMKAAVLWITLTLSSTFFPALMFSLSHYTARLVTRTPRPAAFNLMEMARYVEPCMFGLRFSMMIVAFGMNATLDAAVVLSQVPTRSQLYLKNTLIENIPTIAFCVYLGAKSGNWAFKLQDLLFGGDLDLSLLNNSVTVEGAQRFFSSSPNAVALYELLDEISTSVVAVATLMINNYMINTFVALGMTLGDYIAVTSQVELSPEGIARGTAKEYSSVGLLAFGTWAIMIVFLSRI